MGRQTGITFDAERNKWAVDKVYRGERLRFRGESHQAAEQWLVAECARIDALGPVQGRKFVFAEAATRYLIEEERREKPSLKTEAILLEPVVSLIGELALDQVHDGTLRPFVESRLAQGISHKSINNALGVVRHILHVAHRKWRNETGKGRTAPMLAQVPLLTMLPLLGHQREPRPISWEEQRRLMPVLPSHLGRMALFVLNTGVRDNVACSLRWQWELRLKLDGVLVSVFEVPREAVKGRKTARYVVCNSVAQSIIDSVRGMHADFVFVYRRERVRNTDQQPKMSYRPVQTMNNTAWQLARKKACLGDLHVHDLRHTVGMRLREAGVPEHTRADILWHTRDSMTAHYSAAQVREIRDALELIKDDSGRSNVSLHMLAMESRRVTPESPHQRKTA